MHALAVNADALSDTDIVSAGALASADRNPALVYLAGLLSAASRDTMRRALDRCAQLLGSDGALSCPWHLLRFQHTTALRTRLAEVYSPSTTNKHLAALRGVLKACRRLGLMSREDEANASDVAGVRGSRLPAGRYVTEGERAALFAACPQGISGGRDKAMLVVLMHGLRRDEASRLTLDDYSSATGFRVLGKGGKERQVPLIPGSAAVIAEWLKFLGAEKVSDLPLLCVVSKGGQVRADRPMSGGVIDKRLKWLAARAGLESLSPHDLRRSLVSDLLDASDIVAVQRVVGHSSPVTTAKYDRRGERAATLAMATQTLPA